MNADTLSLANPEIGWLALAALALGAWALAQVAGWHKRLAALGRGAIVRQMVAQFDPKRTGLRAGLVTLALVLLVGAATRPRYGLRETEISNAGIDIALVIDASKSMLVKDVVPDRLKGTGLEVSALMARLAGGRVALVPFAGIPFVQCPLTSDHDVIRNYLHDLRPEDLPVGGTNIGRAIALATELLTGEREKAEAELRDNLMPQFKGSKNKAIVLFSDGEDHEGAALDAARKAAEKGIRIYTVGVGSAFGDPVPMLGPDGATTGIVKDEAGNPVFSKLNMDLLDQIAKATGGQSFRYSNQTIAPQLFAALDALEKAEFLAQFKQLGEDRYQLLLGPALLLLLLDLLLARRSAGSHRRIGLAAASALACLGLAATPQPAQAAWLERENPDIASGRKLVESKKPGEALGAFKQAQATRPESALIWYDIGVAQAWMGSHADAVTSLSRALGAVQARDSAFESDIHYALGTAQLAWARDLESKQLALKSAEPKAAPSADPNGDPKAPPQPAAAKADEDPVPHYKLAVHSLEQALLANPERADVKRNLELARLGAYPPCASRDKTHEPNDTPETAKAISLPEGEREAKLELRICPNERDLFALAVEPGDRVSASVALKPEPASATDDATAPNAKPQVNVAILSSNGAQTFAGAQPGAPAADKAEWTATAGASTALVDVADTGEAESPYTLTLKILPACERLREPSEPNDTPSQAKPFPIGKPAVGRICPGNPDYYRVDLDPGYGVRVAVKSKTDLGTDELHVAIVDAQDRVLSRGAKGKDGTTARLAVWRDPAVFVRVAGAADTEADYDIAIEILPPCPSRDDAYEDNDQAIQANPLDREMTEQPLKELQLCPGDDDWYAVDLKDGESLFVDLGAAVQDAPDAAELAGSLTVEVWDERGQRWGAGHGGPVAASGSIVRTVAVLAPPPGRYRVRVTGGGVQPPQFPAGGLPNLAPEPVDAAPVAVQPGLPITPTAATGQPAPVPKPIPHIALPPGTPPPAVDRVSARLDLPYTLQLRILPPCPAGNDELEPNDAAKDAKAVEVGGERLLRLCKGDVDWLQVTQKAGQNLQISARYDGSHGALDLAVLDESGVKELARAQTATGEDGRIGQGAPAHDTPHARQQRTAISAATVQGGKADRVLKIRVQAAPGVENFYVLRLEEPPPSSDQPQNQPQDPQDKDKQDKDKQDDGAKEQPKPEPDKKDQPPQTPEQKAEQEQRRRQMERNDHNPANLEAQDALRRSPFKNARPDKDW
ncbi:MAG: VWA domain-containing protein [Deltaproteobacteria bacterium]|nr:VWA domain-containing protein [Deltaproteobacteria bacterium]